MAWTDLKDRVSDAFASAGARIDALLDGMTPRDRKLFVGLVAAVTIAGSGLALWAMKDSLASLEARLAERRADLAFVRGLQAIQQENAGSLATIEQELRRHEGTELSAFMEKAAEQAGVRDRLDSVRETTVVEDGDLVQRNYNVSVSKVSVDQMVTFLYEVEAAGYPLRITSATVKVVKVAGENLVNLRMDVAAWRLAVAQEGG